VKKAEKSANFRVLLGQASPGKYLFWSYVNSLTVQCRISHDSFCVENHAAISIQCWHMTDRH